MSQPAPRINSFKQAIVTTIKAVLPELRDCKVQFGRFNLDELEKTSIRSPAVTIGLLNGKSNHVASGSCEINFSCAAFIITEGKDREDEAWNIAEALVTTLHSAQLFGLVQLSAPTNINIQPVISASIKSKGVAILAVEWTQILRQLGQSIFNDQGQLIPELYINDDLLEVQP